MQRSNRACARELWRASVVAMPAVAAVLVLALAAHSQAGVSEKHWAFVPPQSAPLPDVNDLAWSRGRVDRFILARLESAKQPASPESERFALLRRASFDLVGLPPAPEDVEAFLADSSPDAFERAVDRMLASPGFGERFARLWLDVARYGEDQAHIVGDDRSLCYPNAYLYRDWVIRSLNADVPYDEFVRLQLAADLVEPNGTRNLAALGFLGLGPKYYDRGKTAVMADEWEDRVDVVTRGLLGLTVACARCHDHKFDAIDTKDYYALAGVFASTEMYNRPLDDGREKQKNGQAKKPDDAMHIVREGKAQNLRVFIRGNADNRGDEAPRRFLGAIAGNSSRPFEQGSGRRELADAIVARDNPLAARVIVNRVWATLFGRGLVATPSNYGAAADAPSHPELLDDSAVRFMDAGWSLKWLHRELVLSATYRQSSQTSAGQTVDPENELFGRMNRRRLSVEQWRDAILSATGGLESRLGGPSLDPLDVNARRRTIYSAVSRLDLNRMLAVFDFPDPNLHADGRIDTTTPLQKLYAINGPWVVRQAELFSNRLRGEIADEVGDADRRRIERAYWLLYARTPAEDELRIGLEFLAPDARARWPRYAQVLLAANEMLFID